MSREEKDVRRGQLEPDDMPCSTSKIKPFDGRRERTSTTSLGRLTIQSAV